MTFTVAGSIITQANEAGIAITGATSITGGVRFTCTQSYAVGNVIRITGTTNYNGDWMVAAVTGTTFDVLESAQGKAITFVSSQTGTAARGDSSLAGLTGLTGVTSTAIDSSSGFVIYSLADTVKLQINGTLIIAGLREINSTRLGQNEQLVIGQNAISTVQPVIRIGSGGVLVVGCKYTNTINYTGSTAPQYTDTISQQYVIYQKGQYGWSFLDGSGGSDPAPASAFLSVLSGGRFDWLSGTIDFWGNMSFSNGSIVNIGFDGARNSPVMDVRRCSTNIWFHANSVVSIFGLKVIGDRGINVGGSNNVGRGWTFVMLTAPLVFKNYEPLWSRAAISGSNVTVASGSYTIENYAGAFGTERDLVKSAVSGNTLSITYKNSAVGTSMNVLDSSVGTALAYILQSLKATVKTTNGVVIENAVIWTISLNSVQSLGVTNASGVVTIDNIETGFSADNQSGITARFNANDVATWNVRAYESLSAVYQVTMRGINGSEVQPAMVNDAAVTLSRSAASGLTSVATLNDLYDAAKYWNVQTSNVNYPTATTQVATGAGTTIDLDTLNIIVDALAATAFAVNTGTNTITIKASTLTSGTKFSLLKTTGTISFANGAIATCALQGIVVRGTTGVYSPVLNNATVRFTSAGTYDLRNATITGTVTLTNTSGGAVTVQLQPTVAFINSGPNITVDNAVSATLTISGLVAGSRLLLRRTDTSVVLINEIVAGTTRAYTYTYTADVPVEIIVRNASGSPAYQEYKVLGTLTSVNSSITVSQQLDQ
jgi:hypothetical protein